MQSRVAINTQWYLLDSTFYYLNRKGRTRSRDIKHLKNFSKVVENQPNTNQYNEFLRYPLVRIFCCGHGKPRCTGSWKRQTSKYMQSLFHNNPNKTNRTSALAHVYIVQLRASLNVLMAIMSVTVVAPLGLLVPVRFWKRRPSKYILGLFQNNSNKTNRSSAVAHIHSATQGECFVGSSVCNDVALLGLRVPVRYYGTAPVNFENA